MEWLNYHHLLYFWKTAREGSVSAAAKQLRLAQPTVSGQLRILEDALGERLLRREGRRMVLTDTGRVVYRYADEIFTIGRELMDAIKGGPTGQPTILRVGVSDVVPKLIAFRILQPALELADPVRIHCREDRYESLLRELAGHDLDVVVADAPIMPGSPIRAFNHLLGECGVTFFAVPALAAAHRRRFPHSLDGAPMVLPVEHTSLRRMLDHWFAQQGIRPVIRSEFEDSALLKVFGQAGVGIFPAPTAIEAEIRRQYGVRVVGRTDAVRERFYVISAERRLQNPAVVAISKSARHMLLDWHPRAKSR